MPARKTPNRTWPLLANGGLQRRKAVKVIVAAECLLAMGIVLSPSLPGERLTWVRSADVSITLPAGANDSWGSDDIAGSPEAMTLLAFHVAMNAYSDRFTVSGGENWHTASGVPVSMSLTYDRHQGLLICYNGAGMSEIYGGVTDDVIAELSAASASAVDLPRFGAYLRAVDGARVSPRCFPSIERRLIW